MKFLILFAVGVLFGSVQCDVECFRGMFKGCERESILNERITLCDEVQYQIDCVSRYANKCNMQFNEQAALLKERIDDVCSSDNMKQWFDKEKPCYKINVNSSECAAPINEAIRSHQGTDPSELTRVVVKNNKKLCNLFEPFSICIDEAVRTNCGAVSWALFHYLFNPLKDFSNSFCEQLILPANENDGRFENFGWISIFGTIGAIFLSA